MAGINKNNPVPAVPLFAAAVFTSAFLLFQVQPLIGRFLLPWFGGTPDVWTACILFFQIFLLAGYAYAHLSVRFLPAKGQYFVHLLLLLAAMLALPIIPTSSLKPAGNTIPVLQILLICSLSVGLPYFTLSATGPLLSAWFARALPEKTVWRLYSVSNAGSLLALASFPFVFEPLMSLQNIARFWAGALVVFALMCLLCVIAGWKKISPPAKKQNSRTDASGRKHRILWLFLPFCASVELLAVTNKTTQDIAVIPFLWILPLALYLLSFIICFDHQRWYKRGVFVPLFIIAIIGAILARAFEESLNIVQIIAVYNILLFACCMVCHGELYRLRPGTQKLTAFYLAVSAGGAMGGVFVAVVAPLIFNVYHELHLGLLASAAAALLAQQNFTPAQQKRRKIWVGALLVVGAAGILFQGRKTAHNQTAIENTRNFFGVLTVWEESPADPQNHKLLLQHGTTFHGLQFQNPQKKLLPTAYYSPDSGIGLLINNFPKTDNRNVGIVGLGVGTLAGYAGQNDLYRFYEINPQVEHLARKYFTYLADSKAQIDVILGDARLSMEKEKPQNYDILVIDAFSSDAVPVHLLTREAFEIYLKHIAPDGVLALHISTMHLDLQSVVWKLAQHFGLKSLWIESYDNPQTGALAADWILLSRNEKILNMPTLKSRASQPYADLSKISLWTDDHINLLQILK